MEFIYWTSIVVIVFAMIGYPLSLLLLDKVYKNKICKLDYSYKPSVTILIVAHNEEKVIREKLENVLQIEYPENKLEILVSSDNSTDMTNKIVENFIDENLERDIKLYKVKKRKGKTNAQNEAVKFAKGEVIIFTDANAMLDKNSVNELTACLIDSNIAYVSGKLVYVNNDVDWTSNSEATYWDLDLKMREVESKIQTITAGNGALYACRKNEYVDFDPIQCHDLSMPVYYALNNKRAIYNHNAKAYEKAGECIEDEFNRKVRMARTIWNDILPDIRILNIFKYKWFTYFYLGHRTFRYLLSFMHILLLISNIALFRNNVIYKVSLVCQILFYMASLIKIIFKVDFKYINISYYYCITLLAQLKGAYNNLTGKSKPFWEKAESTR